MITFSMLYIHASGLRTASEANGITFSANACKNIAADLDAAEKEHRRLVEACKQLLDSFPERGCHRNHKERDAYDTIRAILGEPSPRVICRECYWAFPKMLNCCTNCGTPWRKKK